MGTQSTWGPISKTKKKMSCDLRLDCNDARGWWKELLLECLGTALYVSVVATADTTAAGQPFVSGATLIRLLYMVQEATKDGVGHFNPAVTAGFALTGEISVILSLLVIAAQFVVAFWVGSLPGCLCLRTRASLATLGGTVFPAVLLATATTRPLTPSCSSSSFPS